MKTGTYIGNIKKLKGKTALILESSAIKNSVLVQFDDLSLDEGKNDLKDCLAHGWTAFSRNDFEYEKGE